jgi:hypothetical protein
MPKNERTAGPRWDGGGCELSEVGLRSKAGPGLSNESLSRRSEATQCHADDRMAIPGEANPDVSNCGMPRWSFCRRDYPTGHDGLGIGSALHLDRDDCLDRSFPGLLPHWVNYRPRMSRFTTTITTNCGEWPRIVLLAQKGGIKKDESLAYPPYLKGDYLTIILPQCPG